MNPYLIIALLITWGASLAGVGYWQNDAGHVAERTAWQTRENTELRLANTKVLTLEEGARKTEQDHSTALAAVSTDYERKLQDANDQRSRDVAAVRAGSIRLRDPGSPGLRACGNPPGQTATAPGGRDGAQGSGLSEQASEFLLGLTGDADDVARQLSACQRVVIEDRAEPSGR